MLHLYMNIFEYASQTKWQAFLPFYKQRNTTCNKRISVLKKQLYKKLVFYFNLPQAITQNILIFLEQQVTTKKQLPVSHQKVILTSYLEHLKHITNLFNKSFIKNNIAVQNLINIKNINHNLQLGALPNTNIQKTSLYTTWLSISYEFATKNNETIPTFLSAITTLADLNYLYSFLIQNTNYLQLKNTFKPKMPKPYNVPTIPLYLIDTPLAIFNFYKHNKNYLQEPKIIKSILNFIPVFYRKHFKQFFIAKTTYLGLANFTNSKKKAKKYLRILQKRLGLYKKKKAKWI